jgi:dipeptidyl aminopeptidase/acylaminoacyl peptidase
VTWCNGDGLQVSGWYYPPASSGFRAPAGELPPLITLTHGGPTSCATPDYSTSYQFWTSRGYALLDVNYGGSSGFGRRYRTRLNGRWGLVDVDDCVTGAQAMAARGLADPDRLVIRGGSAGGYTTLRALTATEVFQVGISLYGVGDLEALARDTHKFESHYHETLVGPYPQERATYRDRSPVHHLDRLSAPILLLHGLDDKVVPPNQADLMADAARAKGLPVAVVMFAGEGHGFRRADTLTAATAAQLSFLGQILGFVPADPVPRLPIENLA